MTQPIANAGATSVTSQSADPHVAGANPDLAQHGLIAMAAPVFAQLADGVGASNTNVREPKDIIVASFVNDVFDRVFPDANALDPQEIRVSLEGASGRLNQDIVDRVMANPDIKWSDVMEPGLYTAVSNINLGPATGFAAHRHYIYVPDNGTPAQIINAGPSSTPDVGGVDQTKLDTQVMTLDEFFAPNRYQIGGEWHLYKADTGASVDLGARWQTMKSVGREIGEAGLNYNFREQNSNSVARTVADAGDLRIGTLGPPPVGWENNLRDELNGGRQAPSEDGTFNSPTF